jgi:hypothetical protein
MLKLFLWLRYLGKRKVVVLSVAVDSAVVQVVPPSHDSCTQNLGEPEVLSALPSSRTSIPRTVAPAGRFTPKPENECLSLPEFVQEVRLRLSLYEQSKPFRDKAKAQP